MSRAAGANTWPWIARIRAHCLIEMTLDQCVQRLRKRITEESEIQRERVIKNVLKHVASTTGRPTQLDRTPSFYTSRSIVNLSGLSVSDPVPYGKRLPSHGALSAIPSNGTTPGARARSRSNSISKWSKYPRFILLVIISFFSGAEQALSGAVNANAAAAPSSGVMPVNLPTTAQQPAPTLSKVFNQVSNENLAGAAAPLPGNDKRRRSGSFSYHFDDLSEEEDDEYPQQITYEVIQQVPLERTTSLNAYSALPGPLHDSKSSEDNLREKVMQK